MSLYGEYLLERLGDLIIETERGFATYRFIEDHTVYIIDIYVRPEWRKSGLAAQLADQIAEQAKSKGFSKMIGSVVPSSRGAAVSMKTLLAYGMVPDSSTNDFILFRKDI